VPANRRAGEQLRARWIVPLPLAMSSLSLSTNRQRVPNELVFDAVLGHRPPGWESASAAGSMLVSPLQSSFVG
jgi:hypothetical protein